MNRTNGILGSSQLISSDTSYDRWAYSALPFEIQHDVVQSPDFPLPISAPLIVDRSCEISWAEIEIPDAPRQAEVSWAEIEVPDAPRQAEISWTEIEVPTAPRSVELSWAEFEIPTAPRSVELSWAEFEIPDFDKSVELSWVAFEIPSVSPLVPRTLYFSFPKKRVIISPLADKIIVAEITDKSVEVN